MEAGVSEAARDSDELTAEERAQVRALLRLLRKAAAEPVDAAEEKHVRRKARDEDFAEVERLRRRKGLAGG